LFGLGSGELVALDVTDIDFGARWLRVMSKGSKNGEFPSMLISPRWGDFSVMQALLVLAMTDPKNVATVASRLPEHGWRPI
jgi:site-specific recombinase XerC